MSQVSALKWTLLISCSGHESPYDPHDPKAPLVNLRVIPDLDFCPCGSRMTVHTSKHVPYQPPARGDYIQVCEPTVERSWSAVFDQLLIRMSLVLGR